MKNLIEIYREKMPLIRELANEEFGPHDQEHQAALYHAVSLWRILRRDIPSTTSLDEDRPRLHKAFCMFVLHMGAFIDSTCTKPVESVSRPTDHGIFADHLLTMAHIHYAAEHGHHSVLYGTLDETVGKLIAWMESFASMHGVVLASVLEGMLESKEVPHEPSRQL